MPPIIRDLGGKQWNLLAFRVSAEYRRDAGYIDHVSQFTGDTIVSNTNWSENTTLHASALWRPVDAFTVNLSYPYTRTENNDSTIIGKNLDLAYGDTEPAGLPPYIASVPIYHSNFIINATNKTFSQQLRFSSNDADSKLNWVGDAAPVTPKFGLHYVFDSDSMYMRRRPRAFVQAKPIPICAVHRSARGH